MPWINGAKILFTVPISGKSHWVYAENFVESLLEHGHEVTCITNYEFRGKTKFENYTEIKIEHPFDYTAMGERMHYKITKQNSCSRIKKIETKPIFVK